MKKELNQDVVDSEYLASKVSKAVMKILNPDNQSNKSRESLNYGKRKFRENDK